MNADRLAHASNRVLFTFWPSPEETAAIDAFFAVALECLEACAGVPESRERWRLVSLVYDEVLYLQLSRPHVEGCARLFALVPRCGEDAADLLGDVADAVHVYDMACRMASADGDWSADRFAATKPAWYVPTTHTAMRPADDPNDLLHAFLQKRRKVRGQATEND